ncbi:MAG: hypothetical protein V1798_00690 [Pseudomonadota bacterium]
MLGFIFFAYLVNYYFRIIAHVGNGKAGLPDVTEDLTDWLDFFFDAGKVALLIVICAAPVFLAIVLTGRPIMDLYYKPREVLPWALLSVGYLPAAILTVVISESAGGALWPPAWVQIMVRLGRNYLTLIGLFVSTMVLLVLWHRFFYVRMPLFLGVWIESSADVLLIFLQAVLFGGFLHKHAEALGFN